MGLFDKKYCDVCGEKIGLMGNKKLSDGNLCKECAGKLSPWFSERKQSTVQEIKEQLAYREENLTAVREFHTTRSLGRNTKVLLDEDAQKFMVTSASNLESANPDVLNFSQVTGCTLDIDEHKNEEKRKDKDGNMVSYNPPKYKYSYDFFMRIDVNHPYFNVIKFKINSSTVDNGYHSIYDVQNSNIVSTNANGNSVRAALANGVIAALNNQQENRNNQVHNIEYQENVDIAEEIKTTLLQIRKNVRDEAMQKTAPKKPIICPYCGATTTPNEVGCCEYCGAGVE